MKNAILSSRRLVLIQTFTALFEQKKNCFSNKPLESRRKLYSAWTKVVNSFVSVFAWPIAIVSLFAARLSVV